MDHLENTTSQLLHCCILMNVLWPLPSNSCCIAAYFAAVAKQLAYMPQYHSQWIATSQMNGIWAV
jgi:hypothetical protein